MFVSRELFQYDVMITEWLLSLLACSSQPSDSLALLTLETITTERLRHIIPKVIDPEAWENDSHGAGAIPFYVMSSLFAWRTNVQLSFSRHYSHCCQCLMNFLIRIRMVESHRVAEVEGEAIARSEGVSLESMQFNNSISRIQKFFFLPLTGVSHLFSSCSNYFRSRITGCNDFWWKLF